MNGTLYIVSTPIGNLEDITLRALRILEEVDLIACEDTRVTSKLLNHFELRTKRISYHEHNEAERTPELVRELMSGKDVALVCDAGTPAISDPGFRLVSAAVEQGINVRTVPGPSTFAAALSVSGLPPSRFAFLGFLPKTDKRRREMVESVRDYPETLVLYESPKRALKTLTVLAEVLGNRDAVLCRELTKMFEETISGTIQELIHKIEEREELKGEVVIVIEGLKGSSSEQTDDSIARELKGLRDKGMTQSESAKFVADLLGVPKNRAYKIAMSLWDETA